MKGKIYDPNFLRVDVPDDEKTDWYRVTHEGFDIYGSIPDAELLTLRMPLEVAATVNKRVFGQCAFSQSGCDRGLVRCKIRQRCR